jgi:AraC-like DNA-binding protein
MKSRCSKHVSGSCPGPLEQFNPDRERPWSVKDLATAVTMSRSTFSARFTELVGEPPIKYLTRWRMHHASRLLTNGHEIPAIASRLGYDSEVAFRKAFTREVGTPPGRYRLVAQTSSRHIRG